MDQTKTNLTDSVELIPHPGLTLEELLESNGISQKELAARLDVTPKHINDIIAGRKAITSAMAHKLATVFSLSAQFWNSLQANYDEDVHQIEDEENVQKEEIVIAKDLPVSELQSWGYLSECRNDVERVLNLRKFMGVASLCQIIPTIEATSFSPKSYEAFKMSESAKIDPYALAVWLRMCTINLAKVEGSYERAKLKELIPFIKKQMNETDFTASIKTLQTAFAKAGVDFQIIHNLRGAPVQGYLRLLDDHALLRVTLRFHYEDVFWFSLFHEIGHLLAVGETKEALIDFGDASLMPLSSEAEANEFAAKTLLDPKEMADYFKRHGLNKDTICDLARLKGIPPAIVVGQLGHKDPRYFQQYAHLRRQINWA